MTWRAELYYDTRSSSKAEEVAMGARSSSIPWAELGMILEPQRTTELNALTLGGCFIKTEKEGGVRKYLSRYRHPYHAI